MPVGATLAATTALSAGASAYGASQQSKAAKRSAQASQAATDQSLALQKQMYDQTREDNMPWHDAGVSALGRISDPNNVLANFQASPDYQYRLSQGLNAVTQNRAVSGLLRSGSALKGVSDYGQNTAASEFADWWNRQSTMAGLGSAANSANATAGRSYAANAQNALTGNANNLASSYQDQANALATGAGSIAGSIAAGVNKYPWGGSGTPRMGSDASSYVPHW